MKVVIRWLVIFMVSCVYPQEIESAKLLQACRAVLQSNESRGSGKWFNRDCSGVICAIFMEAGYPLQEKLRRVYKEGMNNVSVLYAIAEPLTLEDVLPGDLVFFDNTYDRNNNGLSDDSFTHVGIVTDYDLKHDIISFIHYNTWIDKILEEQLSLTHSNSEKVNTVLRWPIGMDYENKRYAGELFNSFARISKTVE